MRILYLDEAGIGKLESDPILVVAGVLINADEQWVSLSERLSTILKEATPPGVPVPAHFHAKDVFHGTREFPRNTWSEERRIALLRSVGSLPAEFDVPVVWAHMDRRKFAEEHPNSSPVEHTTDCYSVATIACLLKTEVLMRALGKKTEVASVMLEQNAELQKRIPSLVTFLKDPGEDVDQLIPNWRGCIPPRHIIDAPACQPKTASNILQLADYCAFAIKRKLQGAKRSEDLTDPIAPQLLTLRDSEDVTVSPMWNPKFMPQVYGHLIEFRDGEFRRVPKTD